MDRKQRSLMIVGIVLLVLLLAGFASSVSGAGDPDKGAGGGGTQSGEYHNGLLGEYYDSAEISNESALRAMRIDERISWSFGYESPLADLMPAFRMTPVNYSIRWSGYIQPDRTGLYVFKTLSDDGVRMTIDLGEGHETIIDSWGLLSLDYSSSEAMSLEEGRLYPFVLEFQQGPLYAAVHLFWEFEGVSLGIVPDTAFYVDQMIYNLCHEPLYLDFEFSGIGFRNWFYNADNEFDCEEVGNIDYDWGSGAPGDITTDVFVGIMRGYILPRYTETLTLYFTVDDALQVWVNDKAVINEMDWHNQETFTYDIDAEAYNLIRIDILYMDYGLGASIRMGWKSSALGIESGIIPKEYMCPLY